MRCVNICWQAMISRIVCWRAMQHSLIAASAGLGLSFGSFLCRCHLLLLFRCSNLPWQQKHTRAWIAALNMRGDVSATWLCMAPKPVKMMFNFVGFICHCHKHMSQCLQLYWSSPKPWTPMTTKRQSQQAMLTITSMKISNALCVAWTSYVIP